MKKKHEQRKPLEIFQVALVVRNIETTIEKLNSLWKIGPFEIRTSDVPDAMVHGRKTRVKNRLAFAKAGPVDLELIEPQEGDNIYWEFLRDRGEGVHHLKIPSSDFERDLASVREKGIGVLQSADTQRVSYAYLDTEPVVGVIFELLQRKYCK
jgi:methylmalonyl-CoA/ethylmalonyl-CoA epimerase